MSFKDVVEEINRTKHYAYPKTQAGYRPAKLLMDVSIEEPDRWLIPCSHQLFEPATQAQIDGLISYFGQDLPDSLITLLRVTNGAELFSLHYRPEGYKDYRIARFRILSSSELVKTNDDLLDIFASYFDGDDRFCDVGRLNYVAFCDLGDGNFLAITLEGANAGSVFFLDHDYAFYPFGIDFTKEAYTYVASSLEEWLLDLARTNGASGMGTRYVPF